MENLRSNKIIIKIIKIILIVIWMITVFCFSNEDGEESANTSKKVTVAVVKTISREDVDENSPIVESTDKIIRKLAHYTLYTIGGFLIMNCFYTIKKSSKEKVLISISFGAIYAVTDELHQFFMSARSAQILDVGIDTLGVVTGVCIYLLMRKLFSKIIII